MSGYASRIEGVNDYVSRYTEKANEDFVDKKQTGYKDAMAKYNQVFGGIDTSNISDMLQQKNLDESIPIFLGMGASAAKTALGKKTMSEIGTGIQQGVSKLKEGVRTTATEIGNKMSRGVEAVDEATSLPPQPATRLSAPVDEGEELQLIEPNRVANRVADRVAEEVPDVDITGNFSAMRGDPEGLVNNATETAENAVGSLRATAGNAVDSLRESAGNAVDSLRATAGNTAESLRATAGNTAESLGAKASDYATKIGESTFGDLATKGVAGIGAGVEGFQAGEDITGNKYAGIGIGAVEAGIAIANPELAIPLAIGDVLAEGFSSLFHHHHKKAPPPPSAPNLIPPPPTSQRTALSRGDIAVPIYNPTS